MIVKLVRVQGVSRVVGGKLVCTVDFVVGVLQQKTASRTRHFKFSSVSIFILYVCRYVL